MAFSKSASTFLHRVEPVALAFNPFPPPAPGFDLDGFTTIAVELVSKPKPDDRFPLSAMVETADYPLVKDRRWYVLRCKAPKPYYALSVQPGSGDRILMHNLLIGETGVDHIDRDGLNNRRSNLRLATPSQNNANRQRFNTNTSGVCGVYWDKARNKWRASIQVNGQRFHIGYYDDITAAARAYNSAALKHYGEFARLNEGV